MLRDVVIYSVGAVMLRNNGEIVCVVSQVSNRANNENMMALLQPSIEHTSLSAVIATYFLLLIALSMDSFDHNIQ